VQVTPAVHLLGEVGQLEERRERARQQRRRATVDAAEQLGQVVGAGRLAHQPPQLLDQGEDAVALPAAQLVAEQRAEHADVGPQLAVRLLRADGGLGACGIGHRPGVGLVGLGSVVTVPPGIDGRHARRRACSPPSLGPGSGEGGSAPGASARRRRRRRPRPR
jgi:hypothetical protein